MKKLNIKRVKELWLIGKTRSYIATDLKVSFNRVKQAIIDLGLEDYEANKINSKKKKELYKRLWVPERKFWVETYSEKEYNEKVEKYATK